MIKNMEQVLFEEIHDAFVDAFSQYETKIDISIEQLRDMLTTRSYNPKLSRGYFDGDKLVGFILIGYREENGIKSFYDTATGTRQEYQKMGIGNLLLKEVIKSMSSECIDRFVLEVLEHNTAAQELYKKHDFKIVRKLNCFEYDLKNIKARGEHKIDVKDNSEVYNHPDYYCSFIPSWQNSNSSYANSREQNIKIDFMKNNKLLGYLIFNKKKGNIMQLGLDNKYRTTIYLEEILSVIKTVYSIERIKLLNIEDGSEMDKLLRSFGMNNFINQFEMEFRNR